MLADTCGDMHGDMFVDMCGDMCGIIYEAVCVHMRAVGCADMHAV